MSALTQINDGDTIASSNEVINANFTALNNEKVETSVIDTDNTLGGASASDSKLATQKATRDFVVATASPVGKSWNEYAESTTGTDSYAITVPGLTTLVAGQTFKFKADVANTGACTLNINGLGAKTIKKSVSSDLATNDILAGQGVVVTYDGTNMQLASFVASQVPASLPITTVAGSTTYTWDRNSHPTKTITHNLGATPAYIRVKMQYIGCGGVSELVYVGGTGYGLTSIVAGSTPVFTGGASMFIRAGGNAQFATLTGGITASSENTFTLSFSGAGDESNLWSDPQTAVINWEVIK